jgi:RimJ/RimL family protein N-acetyltransferase
MDDPAIELLVDPVLLDLPDAFESERLLIRAPRVGDGLAVYEATVESVESLWPWIPWGRQEHSADRSEANVRRSIAAWILREDLRMLLFDKVSGRLVGGSGLHRPDWDSRRFEIGYWVRRSEAGRGYVTEAVRAITAWAFDALSAQRIEIRMDARNVKSWRVAERAGFALEAELVKDRRALDGVQSTTRVYAKTRP